MSHESPDHGDVLAFRQTAAGVIERFVESVASGGSGARQPRKIQHGGGWIDHCGKSRSVRRDYQVFTEPALQPQAGNAEARVLIGEIHVARVEGRFGYSPGNTALLSVFDLPRDYLLVRLAQHAVHGGTHD